MKKIRIVKTVERISVQKLVGMTRISNSEVLLPEETDWQKIAIKPHAQLSVADKQDEKNTVWDVKLVFKTCDAFDFQKRWAYRVLLNTGHYMLIGTDDRPYPVTSASDTMPEKVTDNQLTEVTVSWKTNRRVPVIHG